MKIAVTDACIFIDLMELEVIADFFKLDIELHTTIEVVNELFPEQRQILKAYQSGKQLRIHNLGSDDHARMESIPFPKGLSQEDCSVIYLATLLEDAMVLSSDKLVRNFAGQLSLRYHGIFWIFDQLVDQNIIPKPVGIAMLKKLVSINSMYNGMAMKKEINKRLQNWSTK